MDFLDPKAKRRNKILLFTGYGLMGTLILLISLVLVFSAYGFDVDRKTGEVIQNGMVYVDSSPDGAKVYFNNEEQRQKTNDRYSLPANNYTVKIAKDGYHSWERSFGLDGGEVERYEYPLLIPQKLEPQEFQTVDAPPEFVTQSPDKRWVIVSTGSSLTSFTEYDLNAISKNVPDSRLFEVPAGVFTAAEGPRTLELVEWSTDNRHFLVKHSFAGRYEFVIISRDQPTTSVNINALLAINPTSVALRDKKFDSWYVYQQEGGVLQTANSKKVVTPLLTNVTAFKSHDESTLLYAQDSADGKHQKIFLRLDNQQYQIKEVPLGSLILDIARYDGAWYVVTGIDAEQKTYVYKNPAAFLKRTPQSVPVPISIMKSVGPLTKVSFSQNTRFIVAQSGQHFDTYDAEEQERFKFELPEQIDPGTKVDWMDGHRLLAQSQGKIVMVYFDGTNKQVLGTNLLGKPVMFDRNYSAMYHFNASTKAAGKTGFNSVHLRLPEDR